MDRVLEGGLQNARYLARCARPDQVVVDLAHGHELGGGAGHEHLVGEVHLRTRHVALDDGVAEVLRDLDHRAPGDAVEDRVVLARGGDLAAAHDVEVLARALADVAVCVEQDRLFVAGLQRLHLGQHAVEVLAAGLGVRDQRVGADAPPGGHLGAHAVALALLAKVGAPLPAGDGHIDGCLERVQAHLPVAAVDDRADVAGAQPVARHQLQRRRAQLLE